MLVCWSGRKCSRDHSAETGLSITCLGHVPGLSGLSGCKLQVASGQGYGHGNETAELRTFAGPSEIAPSQTFVLQAMEFSAKFAESFRFSYPVHVRCKWVCKCICPIRLHWQRVYIREVTLAAKRRSYTAKKKTCETYISFLYIPNLI